METKDKISLFQLLKHFNYKRWQLLLTAQIEDSNIDLIKYEKDKITKDISEKLENFFEVKNEGITTDISCDLIILKRQDLEKILNTFFK